MSDGGKGSAPRPYSVPQDEFASNWERTFGMKVAPGTDALVWRTAPAKAETDIVAGDNPDWHGKGL